MAPLARVPSPVWSTDLVAEVERYMDTRGRFSPGERRDSGAGRIAYSVANKRFGVGSLWSNPTPDLSVYLEDRPS